VIYYNIIVLENQVIKNGGTRDRISAELDRILYFKIEAAGLAIISPYAMIRGICDYTDSYKNKNWQPYTAAIIAAVIKELLLIIPAEKIAKTDVTSRIAGRYACHIATWLYY
jgi:hypothetical protein